MRLKSERRTNEHNNDVNECGWIDPAGFAGGYHK